MTGTQVIRKEGLTKPHVLVGITEEAAVVAPLTKVLEVMGSLQNCSTDLALLPCVALETDGVLVQDHLAYMEPGAVFWFEIPSVGRIQSMLGTITKKAESMVKAFVNYHFVARGDVLVVAKTKDDYIKVLQAVAEP